MIKGVLHEFKSLLQLFLEREVEHGSAEESGKSDADFFRRVFIDLSVFSLEYSLVEQKISQCELCDPHKSHAASDSDASRLE